jgi:hypothetical protein
LFVRCEGGAGSVLVGTAGLVGTAIQVGGCSMVSKGFAESRKRCRISPFLAVLVLCFSLEKYDIFTDILYGLGEFKEQVHCGDKVSSV